MEQLAERERILSVLRGERPDRVPWATRLEIWANSKRAPEVEAEFTGVPLSDLHCRLGIGRQAYFHLAKYRLAGVRLNVEFNGREIGRLDEPELKFPIPVDLVPADRTGRTTLTFTTPVGTVSLAYDRTEQMIDANVAPYLVKHIIENENDYDVVFWMLEHAELVDQFEGYARLDREIGETGLAVGFMGRTPFQHAVLDYLGEEFCFFEMYDHPARVERLLELLTDVSRRYVKLALGSNAQLLEFAENYDGMITNPVLFRRYCMPHLKWASETIHAHGRSLACHIDGDVSNLLAEISESGIDVVESFSPWPLTSLRLRDALEAWPQAPILWGVLPSPIFESGYSELEFDRFVGDVVAAAADRPMILGIADQAVQPTLPSRIRRVRELISGRTHQHKGALK
ncbi:MAG TPA: uroporphyrinogen decarboxylase family protein [Spirochaetia bacterium]|nr:uroporphyrinogen decarboxylase family protein [Spirochaetia bacterium]